MPGTLPSDDPWVGQQSMVYDISEIDNTAIAVDASYFIQTLLDNPPAREPLKAALGGLTGFQMHSEQELDRWAANNVTPFFIFDGQPVVGQDEVSIQIGKNDISRTNAAWELYFSGRADEAVLAFVTQTTFHAQELYPILQRILKERKMHFLVAPYNASAQIAYFDMIDSEQCGGIMGSQELLMYPINDCIIRSIDWEAKKVNAISKKNLVKSLNVSDSMFIDTLLMVGSSFMPPFPPLRDNTVINRQPNLMDATNMLRTTEKNIASMCASFQDILQAQDENWLDKYRKARMAVDHFIYIDESGEIRVHDFDKLTDDNHMYLGFQLPPELFHYLNTGLISPRVLSWITHCQVTVLPTLDGYVSEEYRNLVSKQLVPYFETALGLVIPRLNRGLQHQVVKQKVWYDPKFSLKLNHRNDSSPPASRVEKWNVAQDSFKRFFPNADPGSILFELSSLANKEFVGSTLKAPKVRNIESADAIVSLTIWKLLTLNGYVNEKTLGLTKWGVSLATTMAALEPLVKKNPEFPGIFSAALLAFELIKLGLLSSGYQHAELQGWPVNGSDEDKNCVVLISRVGTLLQLRQDASGYTGPLSKSILSYHALITAVGEANRNVIESLLALTFMSGQAKRERSDYWEISHRLPFAHFPDAALGIAVKTYLDDSTFDTTAEEREERKKEFPGKFIPRALYPFEDFDVVFGLVEALHTGITTLGSSEIRADAKADWDKAKKYLERRK